MSPIPSYFCYHYGLGRTEALQKDPAVRIRAERDDLVDVLGRAARAVSARSPLPILQGLLVTVTGRVLRVTGTDLDVTVQWTGLADARLRSTASVLIGGFDRRTHTMTVTGFLALLGSASDSDVTVRREETLAHQARLLEDACRSGVLDVAGRLHPADVRLGRKPADEGARSFRGDAAPVQALHEGGDDEAGLRMRRRGDEVAHRQKNEEGHRAPLPRVGAARRRDHCRHDFEAQPHERGRAWGRDRRPVAAAGDLAVADGDLVRFAAHEDSRRVLSLRPGDGEPIDHRVRCTGESECKRSSAGVDDHGAGRVARHCAGGIGQGVNLATKQGIHSTGGWGEVWYDLSPALHYHLGYGIDNPLDADITAAVGRTFNSFGYTNLIVDVTKKLNLGFEVSYWTTRYLGLEEGNSVTFEFSGAYGF